MYGTQEVNHMKMEQIPKANHEESTIEIFNLPLETTASTEKRLILQKGLSAWGKKNK